MARRRQRRVSRLESNINMTPMGDIALCLLLGFLVITPIVIDTLTASLPQASGMSSGTARQDPVVILAADGTITLDGDDVTLQELSDRILKIFPEGAATERKVMFTGAGEVDYQKVIDVLDELRASGIETFGIR